VNKKHEVKLQIDDLSSITIDAEKWHEAEKLLQELGMDLSFCGPEEAERFITYFACLRELHFHISSLLPTEELVSHARLPKQGSNTVSAQEYLKPSVIKLFVTYFYAEPEAYEFLQTAAEYFLKAKEHQDTKVWKQLGNPHNAKLVRGLFKSTRFSPMWNTQILGLAFNHDVFNNTLATFIGYLTWIMEQDRVVEV
jgi:hypothetical protein